MEIPWKSVGAISLAVEDIWQVEDNFWKNVDHEHGDEHHHQEGHAAPKNLCQFDLWRRNTLEVISRHRHRWCEERGLQIERNQNSKEYWIDPKLW